MRKDWYSDIVAKPIDVVKVRLIEKNPKIANIIKNMDKPQLLTYLYTGLYEEKEWEGVATIISSCNQRDFRRLVKYIYSVHLESPNIIRVMIYTLSNVDRYRKGKKFYLELLRFKNSFEKRFKELLFDLGQLTYIDKLDLINMFRELILKS